MTMKNLRNAEAVARTESWANVERAMNEHRQHMKQYKTDIQMLEQRLWAVVPRGIFNRKTAKELSVAIDGDMTPQEVAAFLSRAKSVETRPSERTTQYAALDADGNPTDKTIQITRKVTAYYC